MPLTMGFGMGLMMLWMVHRQLTSADALGLSALATFIGAHVLVALVVLALPVWVATRIPRLHALLSRVHIPNLKHIVLMLAGAVSAALFTHLWLHGGLF
jgi:hypothetical protein